MSTGYYGRGRLWMGPSRRPLFRKGEGGNRKCGRARVSLPGVREGAWGLIVAAGVGAGGPAAASPPLALHTQACIYCWNSDASPRGIRDA